MKEYSESVCVAQMNRFSVWRAKLCAVRILFIALAISIVALSHPRASTAGPFNSEYFELDNGLQVVVIPNHRAPIVVHMMWYRAGSADDPVGKSGIAHFLEHLMFKATDKLEAGEFSRIVAREAGRIRGLVLDEEIVRPERDVILEERSARTDNQPSSLLAEQISAAQFLRHPYGTPIIGWRHEIETLNHEDALAFYRRYYAPDNAILVVAGDISAAELKPLAEKYYGVIPAAGVPPRRRPEEPPQISPRRVSFTDARVAPQSLTRSYLAPGHGTEGGDSVALQVFAEILGSKSTSRLYQALVVERPLAAWAGSSYQALALDTSRFYVYADALPGVSITEVEAAIDETIAELLLNGPSEEEVASAKGRMQDAVVYTLDNPQSVASIFGNAMSVGLSVEDIESWPDRVAAVTRERVMAAARAVLRLELSVTGILLPAEEG